MEDKFGDFIDYNTMLELNDEITKLLKYMYNNPGKFGVKTNDQQTELRTQNSELRTQNTYCLQYKLW